MRKDAREQLNPIDFEHLGMEALKHALAVHEELGAYGEELVEKNQFGETALRIDIESEAAVIAILKRVPTPFLIISEEHGLITTGDNPQYLAVLDGLDGSDEYKNFRGTGRYGTMLGLFTNTDPLYGDFAFQGIMEQASKSLFYAIKGKGSYVRIPEGIKRIQTSNAQDLNSETRVYFTEADFDRFGADKSNLLKALGGIPYHRLGSTASHYADLATGGVDLVIEPTRKGNFEPAAAYGLVTEAGGVVTNLHGVDLGNMKFREYGQTESLPIISAASPELLQKILTR